MNALKAMAVLLIVLVGLVPSVVMARDEVNCDVAAISAEGVAALEAAETVEDLTDARKMLADATAACNGLQLSGDGTQSEIVIPTWEIPAGIYIARWEAEAESYAIFSFTVRDGECDDGSIFNVFDDSQAETLFESEGCTVVIETKSLSQPWTLTLEALD